MTGHPSEPQPEALPYVCGHDARELDRLTVQSLIYDGVTERLLRRAGVGPGASVIDLGCGGGDVSLLAGASVGSAGRVEGIDRSPAAVVAATRRARAAGMAHLRFTVADVDGWTPAGPVDAVIGRFVLMHQRDPVAVLRRVCEWVRPDGVVAFVESDNAACAPGFHSQPHSPIYQRIVEVWQAVIRAAGAHLDMGSRLRGSFEAAGLRPEAAEIDRYVSGDAASPIFRFTAESLRSMLPLAAKLGVTAPDASEVDALDAALRAEVAASAGTLSAPPAYAVWARVR